MLWNGIQKKNGIKQRFINRKSADRNAHPVLYLGAGSGAGKTRCLQELEHILRQKASNSGNQEIMSAFEKGVFLNVTYGNTIKTIYLVVEKLRWHLEYYIDILWMVIRTFPSL